MSAAGAVDVALLVTRGAACPGTPVTFTDIESATDASGPWTVRATAAGGMVFGASLAARVAALFAAAARPEPAVVFPELTEREREVLDLLAAGRSNDQIAAALFVSGKTVRNIVSSIYAKLHAPDRATAIIRAREAGLGRG